MKYRKKPVVIDAWQFTKAGEDVSKWPDWIREYRYKDGFIVISRDDDEKVAGLSIPTLEGRMTASIGDWIIKGVKDEVYPCKPDVFEATYELVEG